MKQLLYTLGLPPWDQFYICLLAFSIYLASHTKLPNECTAFEATI